MSYKNYLLLLKYKYLLLIKFTVLTFLNDFGNRNNFQLKKKNLKI